MVNDKVSNSEELLVKAGLPNDLLKIVGMKVDVILTKGFFEKEKNPDPACLNHFVTMITGINVRSHSVYGYSIYVSLASGFYRDTKHTWLDFEFENDCWMWILKTEATWYHVSEIIFSK